MCGQLPTPFTVICVLIATVPFCRRGSNARRVALDASAWKLLFSAPRTVLESFLYRLYLFILFVLVACGRSPEFEVPQASGAFVTWELSRELGRSTKSLRTDCIDLENNNRSGTEFVKNGLATALTMKWKVHDDELSLELSHDGSTLGVIRYDVDYFKQGAQTEHFLPSATGESFVLRLSGPDCQAF